MTPFQQKVYGATKQIPKGQTRTYLQIAKAIGKPRASRAVASALAANCDKTVPCHRVIRSDGTLGGYNGLRGSKQSLLRQEQELPMSSCLALRSLGEEGRYARSTFRHPHF